LGGFKKINSVFEPKKKMKKHGSVIFSKKKKDKF
tara:strand:+ start:570 stop:671 length:102 start_codon:yes stop_codon:yes gene_type:complete